MDIARRRVFAALAGGAVLAGAPPALARGTKSPDQGQPDAAAPRIASRPGIEATALGLRPDASEDQSKVFQRAIDQAAAVRAPLLLAPGFYRAGGLRLPAFANIVGVRGATRIVLSGSSSILSAVGADHVGISGLVLDGVGIPLAPKRGLVHLVQASSLRIAECEIVNAAGIGIALEGSAGAVTGNTIVAADTAIFSLDARGLTIGGNTVRDTGNNGIQVWRSEPGDDGTLVLDNRIEGVRARAGGSGQYGNAINVFRAHNVMVRGNRIRNAAFSAVRGNAASNLQISGNICTAVGEVALYAEFGFEGAVIANNTIDGAAVGISVTNFKQGGRLAVVQGNLIRNLAARRPAGTDPNDGAGIGIGVEADTVVAGNVVENAPYLGIAAGWGSYLRDVAISGNVVRESGYGVAVSVAPGAGSALVADNLISGAKHGAIVGMEWHRPVTGDLAKEGAARYAQLSISGNRVR
jgi:uncharacterized secreted repeat protein (TIGR03808 family)